MTKHSDIMIVGSGAAGLFCALHLPAEKTITILTKEAVEESDSFLAQGGICVLKSEEDYESYYEDTMRAGHYENRAESVDIMLRSSQEIIRELIAYDVQFEKDGEHLRFTREGGHSEPRILFHKDITGQEITSKLLLQVRRRKNISIYEHTTMVDLITAGNFCHGIVIHTAEGHTRFLTADYTILACGGLGGLYKHSTNFRHITGDALAIAHRHGIQLEHIDYIQIHPTTLYSTEPGRRFLISESVRGEGAILLDKNGNRFVNELLPRDLLTAEVHKQMEKDGTDFVWLSMAPIPEDDIRAHFPNIYKRCLEEGYDCTKEPIPVVPAQHYFMGGIRVDRDSRTSMEHLYAIGETSCNGVHGRNRLASNSLLESLVFARRAAEQISSGYASLPVPETLPDEKDYKNFDKCMNDYHELVLREIEKERNRNRKDE